MSMFDGHTMTLEQAAALYPLYKEIEWLEELEIQGGALKLIVNGDVEDRHVEHCIGWIKSGGYKRKMEGWQESLQVDDECIQRQLDIAEAMLMLAVPFREMVLNGDTKSERVFNALYNVNWDEYEGSSKDGQRSGQWFLQNGKYYEDKE